MIENNAQQGNTSMIIILSITINYLMRLRIHTRGVVFFLIMLNIPYFVRECIVVHKCIIFITIIIIISNYI